MAEQRADERIPARQEMGQALRRRGILAAAGAVIAGIAMKQMAQPVAAITGNTTGGALILGANSADPGGVDNTANRATRLINTFVTPISNLDYSIADAFVAAASGGGTGVIGISNGSGTGVYGTVYSGDGISQGVRGNSLNGKGVAGYAGNGGAGSAPVGVYGECAGNTYSKGVHGKHIYNGYGVYGEAADGGWGVTGVGATSYGVVARSTSGTALSAYTTSGIYAVNASSGAPGGCGVRGDCTGGYGVLGSVSDGYGVLGQAVTGYGLYGFSQQNHAVVGQTARPYFGGVLGVATIANTVGIYGTTRDPATGLNVASAYAGYMDGNFVVANGFKSAAVPHADGSHRLVYCVEAPEAWLEDFGTARLVDGRADVKLDPDFAAVAETRDYHVFLTPDADCKGFYVTGKGAAGFSVRERQGGASSLGFSYRVVAKRKDVKAGRLAKFDLVGKAKHDAGAPKVPPAPTADARKA